MGGLHAVVVGYRERDPRRFELDQAGYPVRKIGRCISCGVGTWYVRSGQDAYRERDPQIVCSYCYERHKLQIQGEL